MVKTVVWKPKVAQQYRAIIEYLKDEFSEATAEKYILKVEKKMNDLAKFPETGQMTRFKTIRRKKIGAHNYFYYRISGSKILIIFIWDGRMDPEKNPYK